MTITSTAPAPAGHDHPALVGIHHVGLTARDPEASARWYEGIFGFTRHFVEPHKGSEAGGYAIVVGSPDLSFAIGLDHHPGNAGEGFDPTRTGLDHLCFTVATVEELHRWAAHLEARGVPTSGVYCVDGTPMSLLTFTDPDGIQLELIAVAAGGAQ